MQPGVSQGTGFGNSSLTIGVCCGSFSAPVGGTLKLPGGLSAKTVITFPDGDGSFRKGSA